LPPLRKSLSIAVMLILVTISVIAQEQQTRSTEVLQSKIEQLEADISKKPSTAQEIYQRSLLRLLCELIISLQRDVTSLKDAQKVINSTNPAVQDEIANRLQELIGEQNRAAIKIQRITSELQAAATFKGTAPGQSTATQDSQSASGSASTSASLSLTETTYPAVNPSSPSLYFEPAAPPDDKRGDRPERLLAHPALQDDPYPDVPQILSDRVDQVAREIVTDRRRPTAVAKAGIYSAAHEDIYFYTVADAIASQDDAFNVRTLKTYRYLAETARTDKQIGASARSEGSTSAAEKPGFADLLGWAIEHGAVQKEVSGTTLTLSTSPYALVAAANGGDTAELYQNNEFLNRIGISANFKISDQDSVLANARRQQLNEWSVRVRLHGDRSARSPDFRRFWDANIRQKVRDLLILLNRAGGLLEKDDKLSRLINITSIADSIKADITKILEGTGSDETKMSSIRKLILSRMSQSVYEPVMQGGDNAIAPATRAAITDNLIPSLFKAHEALEQARTLIADYFKEVERRPLMTFAYTNQRATTGSDYSIFKFLYERKTVSPMKMVANAGVSVYHRPDRTINQQSVRDFAVALSFEGKFRSPFVTNELDFSSITYAFTGRYQRMLENRHVAGKKADLAVAQLRLEIPVLAGMSLPFSVTYANSTELVKEDHVRANFGFSFDTSKLLMLRKLSRLASGGQ
jgi:hypothetical protein